MPDIDLAAGREQSVRGTLLRTFPAKIELRESKVDGKDAIHLDGYASITEAPYEMWDFWGPYTEVISRGAFAKTLSDGADVALLLNHGGMTMARTKPGTLRLAEDDTGLHVDADLDARMGIVRDMSYAMERGDLDEMSFAFQIVRGQWSPDYTEYRIDEVNINKGDVSVVNYGANPATSVALRSRDLLGALDRLPADLLEQVRERIDARIAVKPEPARGMDRAEMAYLASL